MPHGPPPSTNEGHPPLNEGSPPNVIQQLGSGLCDGEQNTLFGQAGQVVPGVMRPPIPRERLRRLARKIHALGPRPLYELLAEIDAGANFRDRVEVYARLDPNIVRVLGGSDLPSFVRCVE